MCKAALILACLSCAAFGRRVQHEDKQLKAHEKDTTRRCAELASLLPAFEAAVAFNLAGCRGLSHNLALRSDQEEQLRSMRAAPRADVFAVAPQTNKKNSLEDLLGSLADLPKQFTQPAASAKPKPTLAKSQTKDRSSQKKDLPWQPFSQNKKLDKSSQAPKAKNGLPWQSNGQSKNLDKSSQAPKPKPKPAKKPEKQVGPTFDQFVSALAVAAEGTSKFADQAATIAIQGAVIAGEGAKIAGQGAQIAGMFVDNWVSTGFKVKKSPGKLVPEIKAKGKKDQASKGLSAVDSSPGLLAEPPDPSDALMSSPRELIAQFEQTEQSLVVAGELQTEFCSFLAPREGSAYNTTSKGEIVFASRDELGALVAEFSSGKLKQIAATTRALGRYVEDLENELETADESIVKLRREVNAGDARLTAATAKNDEMQRELDKLTLSLSNAQQELKERESALAAAELAAESAAGQLIGAAGDMTEDYAAETAVKLEQELMAAEESANDLAESKVQLETNIATLKEQQQRLNEERLKEADRVRKLEREADEYEAQAEKTAQELTSSETQVVELQSQLEQLKSASGAVDNAMLDPETTHLAKEIEAELAGTGLAAGTSTAPRALSSMKKADLVAECKERNLTTKGTVAELRALLRAERKKDAAVAELVDRGWSEKESRRALDKVAWDTKAATKELAKQ